MNYVDINTFLTIISSKSLAKAAELLYISQPALSHRLSRLEQELDALLIVRHKGVRNIELTNAGKRFVPIAQKWMRLWQETKKINSTTTLTPFYISSVDSLNFYFMPQVYTHFLEGNKYCKLDIMSLRSDEAYHAVENHKIDLAFIANPHFFKKVQTIPLFKESMTFLCAKNAPYAKTLTAADLHASNEIYIPWSNTFIMWHDYWFGTESDVKICLSNMSLLEHFLKIENAWAIVPSTVAHTLTQNKLFKTCNLIDGPEYRTCYAIQDNQRDTAPLAKTFITILLEIAKTFPDIEIVGEEYQK
ncbi:LysR family transcriptional regulator [Clostridium sp.]|uniref:LysR family transcriptional regulator n=1 Tax=Clostridium sp. TaxID=1506 RepID=UPI0032179325